MHWPGYVPWAETVRESRREFARVARSFWLIPEIIPPDARDDVALQILNSASRPILVVPEDSG